MDDVDQPGGSAIWVNIASRIEARLAALEAGNRAEISALKGDAEALRSGNHQLRTEIQTMMIAQTRAQASLEDHLRQCDRRGANLMRLGFIILGAVLAVLGFVLRAFFHLG